MIPDELIRMRSYEIWQQEGCQEGFDLAHWFRAKAELEAANGLTDPANIQPASFVLPRPAISRPPCKLVSRRVDAGGSSEPVWATRLAAALELPAKMNPTPPPLFARTAFQSAQS